MGLYTPGIGGWWGAKPTPTVYTFVHWVDGRYVHEPVFDLVNDAAAVQAAEARAQRELRGPEAHLHVFRSDGTCVATVRKQGISFETEPTAPAG